MPAKAGRARRRRCACSAGAANAASSCCAASWPATWRSPNGKPRATAAGFAEIGPDKSVWEYAALVTSLDREILTLGQLYRDRADCENVLANMALFSGIGYCSRL